MHDEDANYYARKFRAKYLSTPGNGKLIGVLLLNSKNFVTRYNLFVSLRSFCSPGRIETRLFNRVVCWNYRYNFCFYLLNISHGRK